MAVSCLECITYRAVEILSFVPLSSFAFKYARALLVVQKWISETVANPVRLCDFARSLKTICHCETTVAERYHWQKESIYYPWWRSPVSLACWLSRDLSENSSTSRRTVPLSVSSQYFHHFSAYFNAFPPVSSLSYTGIPLCDPHPKESVEIKHNKYGGHMSEWGMTEVLQTRDPTLYTPCWDQAFGYCKGVNMCCTGSICQKEKLSGSRSQILLDFFKSTVMIFCLCTFKDGI